MYDAHDVADRQTNNFIAHHPQELQGRFYDAKEKVGAVAAQTERVRNIGGFASVVLVFLPLILGCLLNTVLGYSLDTSRGMTVFMVGMFSSVTLVLIGIIDRIADKLRQWEMSVLLPYEEEYQGVVEEVYAYQKEHFGRGF